MRFTGLALGLALLAAPAILAQNGRAGGNGGGNNGNHGAGPKAAPEPLTLLGLAVGAGGIALLARRRS
ncbi:MAG TPA: PEP-CTERM sorting domain-containing protein [Myxococcales bacterium]